MAFNCLLAFHWALSMTVAGVASRQMKVKSSDGRQLHPFHVINNGRTTIARGTYLQFACLIARSSCLLSLCNSYFNLIHFSLTLFDLVSWLSHGIFSPARLFLIENWPTHTHIDLSPVGALINGAPIYVCFKSIKAKTSDLLRWPAIKLFKHPLRIRNECPPTNICPHSQAANEEKLVSMDGIN